MAKYTVPAFDNTNATTIAASIVEIPPNRTFRGLRVTAANKVYVHTAKPTTSQEHLDGFPLGPNATDAELGEVLPLDIEAGGYNTLYVTAASASQVRTLAID